MNRFQLFLTAMREEPITVRTITMVCLCLQNLMRVRYPALKNEAMDREDGNHNLIREHGENTQTSMMLFGLFVGTGPID